MLKTLGNIVVVLVLIAAILLLVLFVIKAVWAWTIPDIFPGAVQQGLIAAELSWWAAFKLMLFLAVLFGGNSASSRSNT